MTSSAARTASFWLVGGVLFLMGCAAAAPSPLYRVYQVEFGFSTTALTAVFATYSIVLLATLLVLGSVSDFLGRRPVIIAAVVLNLAACVAFLAAGNVGWLIGARALQGVAVGIGSGGLAAALIELQPRDGLGSLVTSGGASLGLAIGALATSALVEYAGDPTHLVWWVLVAVSVACVAAIAVVRESGKRRPGVVAALWPHIAVPREARLAFVAALPVLIAVWALGGLDLSLGPSLASLLLGPNHLWGGVVIFLLSGIGAVAAVILRNSSPVSSMQFGSVALLLGDGVTVAGIASSDGRMFLIGTCVAGVGFGVAYLGALRTSLGATPPQARGGMMAAIYIANYLAFSIPAVAVGFLASRVGLRQASVDYGVVVAILVVVALVAIRLQVRSPAKPKLDFHEVDMPAVACSMPPTCRLEASSIIGGAVADSDQSVESPRPVPN
jgi:MFS family permease